MINVLDTSRIGKGKEDKGNRVHLKAAQHSGWEGARNRGAGARPARLGADCCCWGSRALKLVVGVAGAVRRCTKHILPILNCKQVM